MKFFHHLAFSLSIFTASLCAQDTNPSQSVAESSLAFGLDIYMQLVKDQKNLCFSPYSITSALVIPYLGSSGETEKQMKQTLYYQLPSKKLAQVYGRLNQELTKHPTNYPQNFKILISNMMWVQENMQLLPQFIAEVRGDFGASVQRVDFVGLTESSRGRINRWVAHQTNNRITELLARGIITQNTRMVVTSALFMKAKWLDAFSKNETHLRPFFSSSKKTASVPTMHQINTFPYLEDPEYQLVELPLEQPAHDAPQLVLDIFLPQGDSSTDSIVSKISAKAMINRLEAMQNERVELLLPRFKITQSVELVDSLKQLGMKLPFEPKADFSGISGARNLMIGNIVHQGYIDVEEGGIEAAAATGASMNLTSMPIKENPKQFIADHPFLYLIRDRKSGVVLFMGRLEDPLDSPQKNK